MPDVTGTFYSSEGLMGYGAQLLVGDGTSPENYVAIAEVTTITPGSIDTADIVRTHLRSPDAHHEHMPAMRDSGEISIAGTLRLDHESQNNTSPNGLVYLSRTRAIRNFKIVLPDETTELPFTAYVSKFQITEFSESSKVGFNASFRPTKSYSADLPGTP